MRYIGIRHRVKKTVEGEARPTQVVICESEDEKVLELEDESSELDFALGRFTKKPSKTKEGLKAGDIVAMALGGSGDNFAYALSRQAEKVGAKVLRLPPFVLKERRKGEDKDADARLLAELVKTEPGLFYEVTSRDRVLIKIRETFGARQEAMKERIACEQLLYANFIGKIFRSEEGLYPEGKIEESFAKAKANDVILQSLEDEEGKRIKEMKKALNELDVYTEVFSKVDGCGPMIAASIISSVIDIRRFPTDAKLKAFCGVHVLSDGKFARKRSGAVANWSPEARQGLYLLGDQWNRRPDSVWGKKLREYKKIFRSKHPEEIVAGKRRYTKGHIHKMATWRTITKFVEWMYREWWKLERKSSETALKKAS